MKKPKTAAEKMQDELQDEQISLFISIEAHKALIEINKYPDWRKTLEAHIDKLICLFEQNKIVLASLESSVERKRVNDEAEARAREASAKFDKMRAQELARIYPEKSKTTRKKR